MYRMMCKEKEPLLLFDSVNYEQISAAVNLPLFFHLQRKFWWFFSGIRVVVQMKCFSFVVYEFVWLGSHLSWNTLGCLHDLFINCVFCYFGAIGFNGLSKSLIVVLLFWQLIVYSKAFDLVILKICGFKVEPLTASVRELMIVRTVEYIP